MVASVATTVTTGYAPHLLAASILAAGRASRDAEPWPCDNHPAPATCLTAPSAEGSECPHCRRQIEGPAVARLVADAYRSGRDAEVREAPCRFGFGENRARAPRAHGVLPLRRVPPERHDQGGQGVCAACRSWAEATVRALAGAEVRAAEAGALVSEVEDHIERLEDVAERWGAPGASRALARRASDKAEGLRVARRLILARVDRLSGGDTDG